MGEAAIALKSQPVEAVAREGFIFGRRLDYLAFGGPVLLASLNLAMSSSHTFTDYAFLLAAVGFDLHHIVTTFPVVYRRYLAGSLRLLLIAAIFLAAPIGLLALYSFSTVVFYHVLAYSQIFHFARQQFGWIMVNRKLTGETGGLRWDVACLSACILGPLAWWHSPLSALAPTSLTDNDLFRVIPPEAARLAIAVTAALIVAYVARGVRIHAREGFSTTKAMILGSTWAWFYGGLVIFENPNFLWIAIAVGHGLPYLLLTSRATVFPRPGGVYRPSSLPKIFALFVTTAAIAALWYHGHGLVEPEGIWWPLKVLVWVPIFWHYMLDAVIWRKRYDPRLGF